MFNCFFTLWMFCCLFLPAYSKRWLFGVASAAALTYLTRPDGLLIVFVTIGLVALAWYVGWRRSLLGPRDIAVVFPLLAVPLHFAWRMSVYGEWLPNTYYAKRIAGRIWLESGIRYFLSFIVEYSLWIWLILLVALIIRAALLLTRAEMHFFDLFAPQNTVLINIAVILTLLAHVLYYTIAIGGDHFEFRVYSHLILLLFISFLWMLNAMRINAKLAGLFFILFVVCSWPIPWTHWSITHTLITRKETGFLKASVAEAVQRDLTATPGFLLDYLRWYDSMQFWLIDHAVCMRHQTHKVFYLFLVNVLPSRGSGMALPNDQYPVITEGSVGVLGWVLPTINVIDVLGLNDSVIARNPDVHSGLVAHERTPPPGYVECFAPNVTAQGKDVIINRRAVALTAAKIVQCEHYYAAIVTK
jgi:arabinofuranosyltransferase